MPRAQSDSCRCGQATFPERCSCNYADMSAVYVSAATLWHFIPSNGTRKFSPNEVWEIPWAMLRDVRQGVEGDWHYFGCRQCRKKECREHGQDYIPCYALEATIMDHTATVEVEMFTAAFQMFLAAIGHADKAAVPVDQKKILKQLQAKRWSLKLADVVMLAA
eukprot:s221_g4.t1